MSIERTNLPNVLPGANTSLPDASTRDLETRNSALQNTTAHPLDHAGVEAPLRPVDAGEGQVGSDPWTATGASSRMLTGPLSSEITQTGETLTDATLHDAVRGAVNLVFADVG